MFDSKIHQQFSLVILRSQTCISQIARDFRPILKASIVEILQFIRDDERHYSVGKAFLEHNQSPSPPIPVLKAPSIFPEAHQFLTVLSETPFFLANSAIEI